MTRPFRLAALLFTCLVLAACDDPSQTEMARGNVLRSRGQLGQAEQAYRAAAKASPRHPRPLELLGNLLLDEHRDAEARAAFEQVLALDPGALDALIGIGRVEASAGHWDAAIDRMGALLKRQPDNLYALLSRADLALTRGASGDAELAINDTARAMLLDAKSEPVLYTRARAFIAARKLEEALQTLELLRKDHPSSFLPAYGEALIAVAKGDATGAAEDLKSARALAKGAWRPADIQKDPFLTPFRADPAIVAAIGP